MKLKDKLTDNELDLSLCELNDVPVKEMLAIPKATEIDLSRNHLKTLPANFAALTHITKLDLSKNELTELPQNFGNLINLRYLDLYSNKLTTLPVGFCRLKNLQWLDLKDNPLEGQLKAVAGDCLVKEECQNCAKKVVAYLQAIASNLEREKQKKLKEERERESAEKAKRLKAAERERKQKKAERERRKAEAREKRLREQCLEQEEKVENVTSLLKSPELNGKVHSRQNKKKSGFLALFFYTLLLGFLTAICTLLAIHVHSGRKFDFIDISHTLIETWKLTAAYMNTWQNVIHLQLLQIKELFILWTNHLISYWHTYTTL